MDQGMHRSYSWYGRSVYLPHSHNKSLRVFRKSFIHKYARFTSLRRWFDVIWWSKHGKETATHPVGGLLSVFNIKSILISAGYKSHFHPRTLTYTLMVFTATLQPERIPMMVWRYISARWVSLGQALQLTVRRLRTSSQNLLNSSREVSSQNLLNSSREVTCCKDQQLATDLTEAIRLH